MIFGHFDTCIELLEADSDPNLCNKSRKSLLICAAELGHERIVELLITFGANPFHIDDQGDSASSAALKKGHQRISSNLQKLTSPGIHLGPFLMKKTSKSIHSVLAELNLEKYQANFANLTFEDFKKLTESDLKDLGISLIGPRRKISSAIGNL